MVQVCICKMKTVLAVHHGMMWEVKFIIGEMLWYCSDGQLGDEHEEIAWALLGRQK